MEYSTEPNLPIRNPYIPPPEGRCPINELPAELLALIFELGAQDDQYDDNGDGNDDEDDDNDGSGTESSLETLSSAGHSDASDADDSDLPFELLITRICKHWRYIAIEAPSLWARLDFELPFNLDKGRAYLTRAKGAPLEIAVDCTFDDEFYSPEEERALKSPVKARTHSKVYAELAETLDLLVKYAAQWRSFECMVSRYVLMQLTLERLATLPEVPMLEVLQLYHYEDGPEVDDATFEPASLKQQDFVLFHNQAPRLTHVALWGVHLNWSETTYLTGLHEFELAYHTHDVRPSHRDFLRILNTSPQLHTLTLCQSGPSGTPIDWLESVQRAPLDGDAVSTHTTIPSIANLVIAFLPADYLIALIDRLSMPNVTSLALDFDEEDDCTGILDRLGQPPPGSSKSLFAGMEALKLSGLRCRATESILRAGMVLQNLKQLTINFEHVDSEWLDMLMNPEDLRAEGSDITIPPGMVLCPNMEIFSATGLDGKSVRELVQRRKDLGRPIRELWLNEDNELTVDDHTWLRRNVEIYEVFEGTESAEEIVEIIEEELDPDDFSDLEVVDGDDEEWTDED